MPAMSAEQEADIEWGKRVVSAGKAKNLYSSFFSEGIEYKLYDNVEVYNEDHEEPFIAKIMKLWEDKQSRVKKVLLRWFLRLRDLDPQLEGDSKELFLAFGKGKGVTNENDLEVVCGKIKVLCTSTDARNKQPSDRDLKNADFYFSKIYNVDRDHVSPVQRVVDKLGYEAVYNKEEWISEAPKDLSAHYKQPKLLPISGENLSKREIECSQNLNTTQKEIKINIGRKVSHASLGKRNQVSSAAEDSKKKSKTSASTAPKNMAEPSRFVQEEQSISPSKSDIVQTEISNVDTQKVKRELNSQGCSPPWTDAEVNISRGLPDAVGMDGQLVQKKLDFQACVPPQARAKPLNLGKVPSITKSSVVEIMPFQDVDTLEKHATNANVPRQLNEKRSSSNEGQRSLEVVQTLAKVDDAPECAVSIVPRISSQLSEANTMPKKEKISVSSTFTDSLKAKEQFAEMQSNLFKPVDRSFCLVEAETSKEALFTNNLKVKTEAEVAGNLQDEFKLSALSDTEMFVQDSATKYTRPNIIAKQCTDTGSETEKQSVSAIYPRNKLEKAKLFKDLSWEDNLQQGFRFGKVILLQNLDVNSTSADIRDMLKSILQGISDVQIIPQASDCPYGKALAVFDSRMFADSALQEIEKSCLVSTINERPIMAMKAKVASNSTKFPGHLALDKLGLNRSTGGDHYNKAVSTSHSSQPNTIEYEMAMQWRHLQQIIQTCRAELFKKQKGEIEEMMAR